MLLLPFAFLLLCLVLIAIFTAKMLLIVLAVASICAFIISFLWKTPSREKTKTKHQILCASVAISLMIAFPFAVENAKSILFPDTTDLNRRRDEITQLFNTPDIDNKFTRGYTIAAAAKEDWERRDLRDVVLEAFLRSKAEIQFSEEDLVAAQKAYDVIQKPLEPEEQDVCGYKHFDIYPKTVVSREGPVSVINFLRDHYRGQHSCRRLSAILYEVEIKCKTIWASRCTTEINRQELEAFLEKPIAPVPKSDIEQFIVAIFHPK